MAGLPRLHPSLSLHLADRALTTLISSAPPPPPPSPVQHPLPSSSRESGLQHDGLTALTTSALSIHDAASRLGLGFPQRVLVEYGHGGPILIQTFLHPTAAAGLAGRDAETAGGGPHSSLHSLTPSSSSFSASVSARQHQEPAAGPDDDLVNGVRRLEQGATAAPDARQTPHEIDASRVEDYDDDDSRPLRRKALHRGNSGGNLPLDNAPMLVGIVLAASSEHGADARRAAARLERIGREIQGQWAAAERAGDHGG